MKIVYHCYGGAHSSIMAAGVHLGLVPTDRTPTVEELRRIPLFDEPVGKDHGIIRFMGRDEYDNEIYTLGRRKVGIQIKKVLTGMADVAGISGELVLVDVLNYVNWQMMLGGFSSRKLGLVSLGRPVVTWGSQRFFWDIRNVVQQVKLTIASNNLSRGR